MDMNSLLNAIRQVETELTLAQGINPDPRYSLEEVERLGFGGRSL